MYGWCRYYLLIFKCFCHVVKNVNLALKNSDIEIYQQTVESQKSRLHYIDVHMLYHMFIFK